MTILHLIHKALWYIVCAVPAIIGSLFAMSFAPVICLAMDRDGYLPKYLKWFEPTDTASGCLDTDWRLEHPDWSDYKCGWTFIKRNPFYGFLAFCSCNAPTSTKRYGGYPDDAQGVSGWYFILGDNGAFQFRFVYPIWGGNCIQGDYGWQLVTPTHKTYRMLQLAPIRFYKFGK